MQRPLPPYIHSKSTLNKLINIFLNDFLALKSKTNAKQNKNHAGESFTDLAGFGLKHHGRVPIWGG